jgi:hypothetical protein
MKRAQKVKEECERIWNETDTAKRCSKAKWRWCRGHLVLYVAGRYQSESDTDWPMDEQRV